MPLSNYDHLFGGKPGAAAEAHASMVKQYGPKQGESVFYATVQKRQGQKRKSVRQYLKRP